MTQETMSLESICRRENPSHELYLRYIAMSHGIYKEQTKYAYTRGILWLFNVITKSDKFYMNVLHDGIFDFLMEGKQLKPSDEKKVFKLMQKNMHKKLRYILNTEEGKTAAWYGICTLHSMINSFKDNRENDDLIANVIKDIIK